MRPRLTYANVVATLALFVALGGASYAVTSLPKNSVGSKQLKAGAVGSKHLKQGAVGTRALQDNSVGSEQLKTQSVGSEALKPQSVGGESLAKGAVGRDAIDKGAIDSGKLAANSVSGDKVVDGSLQAADIIRGAFSPRLFAHVNSGGVLGENAGVESAGRISTGQYFVRFNRDLHGCVAVATVGFGFGPGVIGAGGTAQARMNLDNDPNKVGVTVYRKGFTFADVEDNDVHLIVAC